MATRENTWKAVRTEFCAHYLNKDDNMHMYIIPSLADTECYHVILELHGDDSNMEFHYLTKDEIEKAYNIVLFNKI